MLGVTTAWQTTLRGHSIRKAENYSRALDPPVLTLQPRKNKAEKARGTTSELTETWAWATESWRMMGWRKDYPFNVFFWEEGDNLRVLHQENRPRFSKIISSTLVFGCWLLHIVATWPLKSALRFLWAVRSSNTVKRINKLINVKGLEPCLARRMQ